MKKASPKIYIDANSYEWRLMEVLKELGTATLDAFLPKNYPQSQPWRDLLGLDKKKSFSEEEQKRIRARLSRTLTRLRRKGLVKRSGTRRRAEWSLNSKQIGYVNKIKNEPPPADGKLRIVIFDIPEYKRYLRVWIRTELTWLDFVLLQKSVWLGRRPLSESFLREIFERDLADHVHIFEIKKGGTLDNLGWKNIS